MAVKEKIEYVGQVADEVGKTADKVAEALKKVDRALRTAMDLVDTDHEVRVRVVNLTDFTLDLADAEQDNGNWANIPDEGYDVFPANSIGPREIMGCVSADIGFATGTKGSLVYRFTQDGDWHSSAFLWDNGFWTSNSASGGASMLDFEPGKLPKFRRSTLIRAYGHITGGRKAKAIYYIVDTAVPVSATGILSLALQSLNGLP